MYWCKVAPLPMEREKQGSSPKSIDKKENSLKIYFFEKAVSNLEGSEIEFTVGNGSRPKSNYCSYR